MQRRVTHREHTHTYTQNDCRAMPCHASPSPLVCYILHRKSRPEGQRGHFAFEEGMAERHKSSFPCFLAYSPSLYGANCLPCYFLRISPGCSVIPSFPVYHCKRLRSKCQVFFFQCARHATCVCIHCRYATRGCKCFIASMNREVKGRVV